MLIPKNILIVRTDRIGDVVLTLPLASIIKKKFSSARITFLAREYTKPLTENTTSIDSTIVLEEKNGKPKIFANVKILKNRFDTCIVAFPTFRIALILFLAGIKTRIGTGYRFYSFLFNKKTYEHRKYGERHELEYNINLLKHIGINEHINEKNVSFSLQSDDKIEHSVIKRLNDLGIDTSKQIVIIHPGSGGSAVDLPISKLKQLSELMAQGLGCEILITGGSSERKLCESLLVNEKTKNIAGLFDLKEMISIINLSTVLIANSTGPIHIAAALGNNVIGFYPKVVACSPKRWGPYTEKKIIFTPNLDCNNCTIEQCEKLNCMDTININLVFDSVKKILNAS